MTQSRGSLMLQVSLALAGVLRRLMTRSDLFLKASEDVICSCLTPPDPPFSFKITAEREERIDVKHENPTYPITLCSGRVRAQCGDKIAPEGTCFCTLMGCILPAAADS